MPTANGILTSQARAALKGHWRAAVGAFVIYLAIGSLICAIPILGWIASIFVSGPLVVGLKKYFLRRFRQEQVSVNQILDGFSCFVPSFLTWFFCSIFIFLWLLLLIVPGIIAALSYAMALFIVADNPGIDALQAIRKSKEMMRGNKGKLFCLACRFIGWFLLGILSLGIGFLWIGPYWATSLAAFYQDLAKAPELGLTETAPTTAPIVIP